MDVREKLAELLKSVLPNFRNNMAYWGEKPIYEFADCLLANGVTVQEWISVDDRLPELDTDQVLVLDENGNIYNTWYDGCIDDRCRFGHYRAVYNSDTLGFDGVDWVPEVITKKVTHWMPLPEPPKEVEE